MRQRTKKYLGMVALGALDRVRGVVHEWTLGEPVWVSSDGTPYRYSEIGDRHLRNILAMLRREGEAGSVVFQALEAEQARRFAVEQDRKRRNYEARRWASGGKAR